MSVALQTLKETRKSSKEMWGLAKGKVPVDSFSNSKVYSVRPISACHLDPRGHLSEVDLALLASSPNPSDHADVDDLI
jgi:hypothetical protein